MRRHQESEGKEWNRAIALGEDNVECIDNMRKWCKYFEIERTSYGLYAEMTGLPIASHKIGCPKVEGSWEGMNLRWICSDFLIQHCAGCKYHEPNGPTDWGEVIIVRHRKESAQRELATQQREDRIRQLRSDLKAKADEIGNDAAPDFTKIVAFFDSLFSDDDSRSNTAAQQLRDSARLASDVFPEAAIELLLFLIRTESFAEKVIPICAELAERRQDYSRHFEAAALDNIRRRLRPHQSAIILSRLRDQVTYPLDVSCIESLLLTQDHQRPIGGWRGGEPDYSSSTAVLVRCVDANPKMFEDIIRRSLSTSEETNRFQLCGALELIQGERPQLILELLNDLLASLDCYQDDLFGSSSLSGKVVHVLQAAFRNSPERLDGVLSHRMEHVRPAVQEDLIKVYRDQFLDHSLDWKQRQDRRDRSEVSECERIAIRRLLSWMKNDSLEPDIRCEALEALELACKYATEGVLDEFESLLGYLAVICHQPDPPKAPPKIILPNQEEPLERIS